MVMPIQPTRVNCWLRPSWVGTAVLTAAFLLLCCHPRLLRAFESADGVATDESKRATNGPLRVDRANPRYFCDRDNKIVFLTGSHTWSSLQDYSYAAAPSPPLMDFKTYLAFLTAHNHNFFRLWTWESSLNPTARQSATSYDPLPYERVGPGAASDGQPKFDITRFNQAYFDRLRARAQAAQQVGIYVSVMLFQGFSIEGKGNIGGDPWNGHPFNPRNNVNGFDGGGHTNVHTRSNTTLTAHQEAYVRKVIDSVNDLDNVLYEITNEDTGGPANTEWQIHMIKFIKRYEATKPQQHVVGMTAQWPNGNDDVLVRSPADWISPAGKFYSVDGRKVVLNDTDHSYFWTGLKKDGIAAQRAWVWANFTRGNQCLFMDPYLDPSHDPGRNNPAGGRPDPYWEPLRTAMGQTRAFASRMNLAAMVPHDELASTKYCLADPGREYLLYLPEGGDTVVDLSMGSGPFRIEWLHPADNTFTSAHSIMGGAKRSVRAPFSGDAVLHIEKE